jgi:hypothetical protein
MQIRPDFDIHNEDPRAEDPNQCRLLIEVGSCSLIFILLNVRGMRPSAIRLFQWPQLRTNEPETIIRRNSENDPILSRFKPAEIFLVYNFPESNLIPEKFFSADMTRPVTDLIYGDLSHDLVWMKRFPGLNFKCIPCSRASAFSDAGKIRRHVSGITTASSSSALKCLR